MSSSALLMSCATQSGITSSSAPNANISEAQIVASSWHNTADEPYRGKQVYVYFLDSNRGWYINGYGNYLARPTAVRRGKKITRIHWI